MSIVYKKDKFYEGYKVIANIRKNQLREGTGSSVMCNIKDHKVRSKNGSSTICNIKNGDVRKANGSSRIAKIKDIRKEIKNSESVSDEFMAAIWYFFIN